MNIIIKTSESFTIPPILNSYNVYTLIFDQNVCFESINYLEIKIANNVIWNVPFWYIIHNSKKIDFGAYCYLFIDYNIFFDKYSEENQYPFPCSKYYIIEWKLNTNENISFEALIIFSNQKPSKDVLINQYQHFHCDNQKTSITPKHVATSVLISTYNKRLNNFSMYFSYYKIIEYNTSFMELNNMEFKKSSINKNLSNCIYSILSTIFPNEIIYAIEKYLFENNYYYQIPFGIADDHKFGINMSRLSFPIEINATYINNECHKNIVNESNYDIWIKNKNILLIKKDLIKLIYC